MRNAHVVVTKWQLPYCMIVASEFDRAERHRCRECACRVYGLLRPYEICCSVHIIVEADTVGVHVESVAVFLAVRVYGDLHAVFIVVWPD